MSWIIDGKVDRTVDGTVDRIIEGNREVQEGQGAGVFAGALVWGLVRPLGVGAGLSCRLCRRDWTHLGLVTGLARGRRDWAGTQAFG